jgi:hypothetical protein
MSVTEFPNPRPTISSGVDARISAAQVHARGVLRDRLSAEFPAVSPATLGELVDEAYARTSGARIQAFRVVLAERDVRARLRAGAPDQGSLAAR